MNLQKFWYVITIFGVLSITFYLGFLYGNRERMDARQPNLVVVGPNLSIENSLTRMEIRDIRGSRNAKDIETFGQLYFKSNADGKTELLIRMAGVPAEVKQAQGGATKSIPNELHIQVARRSLDGLDFITEEIGTLVFDEPINNVRSGRFSTVYDKTIVGIDRIQFVSIKEGEENIFLDSDPDLPPQVRTRPAPYFWVEL